MREVTIELKDILNWLHHPVGVSLVFPVKVGWPELQLTEEQSGANAIARGLGRQEPYEDNSIFMVKVTR
jgi:hypothetical protein